MKNLNWFYSSYEKIFTDFVLDFFKLDEYLNDK